MRFVLAVSLAILAIALAVQTSWPQFLYGQWLNPAANIDLLGLSVRFGLGYPLVFVHWFKVVLLAVAAELWRRGHYFGGLAAVVFFIALTLVSIGGNLGHQSIQRDAFARKATAAEKREADLRAELASIVEQLKTAGWQRASSIVEADIAAQRRDPLWISSSECTEASTRQLQRYCVRLDRLTGELSAARGAENLRQREQDLRSALLEQAPAEGGAHPDLIFFVDTFGMPVEAVVFWRTIMLTFVIELSEPLAGFFATLLFRGYLPSKTDTRTYRLRGCLWAMVAALAARWRGWPLASLSPALAHQLHPTGQAVSQGGSTRKRKPSAPEKPNRHVRSRPSAGVASGGSSAQKKQALDQAEAVSAFVAVLPKDGAGRVAGSDIYAAYDRCLSIGAEL